MTALAGEQVELLRATLLAGAQEFRADWVARSGAIVVPFAEELALPYEFANRACTSFGRHGHDVAWGFSAEELDGFLPAEGVAVPLRVDALDEWHSDFMPFDMVLTMPDLSQALMFTQDEFGLFAGPEEAAEEFFGEPLSHVRRDFREYAAEMAAASRHLPGIAERYAAPRFT